MPRNHPHATPRVLVLAGATLFRSFFDADREARLARGFCWQRRPDRTLSPALRRRLAGADALVTTWDSPPLDETVLEAAPALRLIAHCGGEVKARFAPALFRRLTIAHAPAPMAASVAELALAFILHATRRLDRYHHVMARGSVAAYRQVHLRGTTGETLDGCPVGLVGVGRIGRALADLLRPFGARLEAFDPRMRTRDMPEGVQLTSSLDSLLRRSHVVVLAAALTPESRHLLDRRRLSLLPDDALVVNVGRGGLVDLDALTAEVAAGRLRCALDVTDPLEPLPRAHPLRRLRGALVTPHVGASDRSVRWAMADTTLDTLERFFADLPIATRVTPAMLRHMT